MRRGLPYGWWKSLNFWAFAINGTGIGLMLAFLILVWWM